MEARFRQTLHRCHDLLDFMGNGYCRVSTKMWGEHPPCPHWRATVKREQADYEVLFGTADVTITDHRGQVLYGGGTGVLYAPNGNPDGSGVNLCKLTAQ